MDQKLVRVYSEFGACVFFAQNLELDVVILLAAINAHEKPCQSTASAEEIFGATSRDTLGTLVKKLSTKIPFLAEELATLKTATTKRNHLVHSFLAENCIKLTSENGRNELVVEIISIRSQLKLAQEILEKRLNKYISIHGLSVDEIVESARKTFNDFYS